MVVELLIEKELITPRGVISAERATYPQILQN
jgi:hypothetical protein